MHEQDEHKKWLKRRRKGIGASDAASVIGLNQWKTNVQLWEEKTGKVVPKDISDKPVVKYGVEAEPLLRELFKLDFPGYNVKYDQFRLFKNPTYPFIFATLDGWMEGEQNGVLEIKTTQIFNPIQWQKWDNKIPDNYYIQCLHQLLATGFDFVILKAQIKHGFEEVKLTTRHYTMMRADVLDDLEYLKKKEIEFWDKVQNDERPNLILPEI